LRNRECYWGVRPHKRNICYQKDTKLITIKEKQEKKESPIKSNKNPFAQQRQKKAEITKKKRGKSPIKNQYLYMAFYSEKGCPYMLIKPQLDRKYDYKGTEGVRSREREAKMFIEKVIKDPTAHP